MSLILLKRQDSAGEMNMDDNNFSGHRNGYGLDRADEVSVSGNASIGRNRDRSGGLKEHPRLSNYRTNGRKSV